MIPRDKYENNDSSCSYYDLYDRVIVRDQYNDD